jgi:hypothetical protein
MKELPDYLFHTRKAPDVVHVTLARDWLRNL